MRCQVRPRYCQSDRLHPQDIGCAFHYDKVVSVTLAACPVDAEQGFPFGVNRTGGRIDVFRSFGIVADVSCRISDDTSPSVPDRYHDSLPKHGINVSVLSTFKHSQLKECFFIKGPFLAIVNKEVSVYWGISDTSHGTELFPAICHRHSHGPVCTLYYLLSSDSSKSRPVYDPKRQGEIPCVFLRPFVPHYILPVCILFGYYDVLR